MIDKTKWGVAYGPRFLTASGELEVEARFTTKAQAVAYKKTLQPHRVTKWSQQWFVVPLRVLHDRRVD